MSKPVIAAIVAFLVCLIIGKPVIAFLKKLKYGQVIRDDGPSSHLGKSGTPSMGGVMIVLAMVVGLIVSGVLKEPKVLVATLTTCAYGLIGFIDDYIKIVKKRSLGLLARQKLALQFIFSFGLIIYAMVTPSVGTTLSVPFFPNLTFDLGIFYIPFALFFILAFVNAVNLTDGLDGLASGTSAVAAFTYSVIAFATGRPELASFGAAIGGSCIGFTWYNSYPAKIFMGDTGSLALGGALVSLAILTKTELAFLIIGGVFVIETVSVVMQVTSFKLTGRRVFKMSPLHHHYELVGYPETVIVTRFWILAAILGVIGFFAI